MIRPARLLALVVGVAALAAGCAADPPPAPSTVSSEPTPSSRLERSAATTTEGAQSPRRARRAADEAAIGALVRARAAALGAGRPAAYARTATGARRRQDRLDAVRARQLGAREVQIASLGIRVRGSRAVASVRSSYRVNRLAGRWSQVHLLRVRRTGGGWRVAGQRSRGPRPPWELASYRREDTPHFSIFAPDGVRPGDAALAAGLERAYAVIRKRLPGRIGRRYPVYIAADTGDMAAMTSGIRDVGRLSAITDLSLRTSGPAERVTAVLGARILVPWPSFVALGPDARQRVLTHELAHAALARATSGRAPAWLQEGLALYVSGDPRTSAARAALAGESGTPAAGARRLARLARPDAMAGLAGPELGAAYAVSASAAHYIAGRFGSRRLLDLLAAFGDESLPGRAGPALADRATRRVLGIGTRRLERDVAAWLRDGAPALGG